MSFVVTVYEYAMSSVADVTAVDVIVGASLTFATVIDTSPIFESKIVSLPLNWKLSVPL